MYKDVEGRSVKVEAIGKIDKDYVHTLDFLLASHEKSSPKGTKWLFRSFSLLTLPTHNDLLKILSDLEL